MGKWIPILIGSVVGLLRVWCLYNEMSWLAVALEWLLGEVEKG
jgi:hypothetical protein